MGPKLSEMESSTLLTQHDLSSLCMIDLEDSLDLQFV